MPILWLKRYKAVVCSTSSLNAQVQVPPAATIIDVKRQHCLSAAIASPLGLEAREDCGLTVPRKLLLKPGHRSVGAKAARLAHGSSQTCLPARAIEVSFIFQPADRNATSSRRPKPAMPGSFREVRRHRALASPFARRGEILLTRLQVPRASPPGVVEIKHVGRLCASREAESPDASGDGL